MSEKEEPRPSLRERMGRIGRMEFIRDEMQRLGFWSPENELSKEAIAKAVAELKLRTEELQELRTELTRLDGRIREAGDLQELLGDIRRKRIERVRAAREARRRERAREAEERQQRDREWRRQTLPFLGRDVSAGLRYERESTPLSARVAGLGLPALLTAADVAAAIGIRTEELAWLTYHRGAATIDHYHRFTIPKRTGGTRIISSPKRRLRTAQQWLLTAILEKVPVHDAAMAFRPERSIVENAGAHAGKAIVLRIDLEEFFPSITFRRVKGLFQSFGYNEGVATLLALLATEPPRVPVVLSPASSSSPLAGSQQPAPRRYFVSVGTRRLPQGACTSPAITNILCRALDTRLTAAARRLDFAYTRYADDLVFSHGDRAASVGQFLALVRRIVADEGFRVNEAKTRVMRPQHRQSVTGLVVNREPAISRADLRRFRSFLHHCETEGLPAMSERLGRSAVAYAAGYVAFIAMVAPEQAAKIRQAHPWITQARGR
jgi:RNA-directed DNA polymerase